VALHRLKTLPVDLDAMTTSQATDLTGLLAGTADGGFAVDDEGRILVWTRAERGGRTVRMIRDVPAAQELLALIRKRLAVPAAPPEPTTTGAPLTRREVEILHMIADGLKTRAIALRLHVSSATVRNHVQNILHKLDAHSRLEAVACARRLRLIGRQ
jgi:DNA-binding CsgD family transcriptional regulator